MKQKYKVLLLLFPLLLLLGACEFKNLILVNLSDLFTLASSTQENSLSTKGDIQIQTGTKKACEENRTKIDEIVIKYFSSESGGECVEDEMKSYYKREIRFALLREAEWVNSDRITAVLVKPGKEMFHLGLGLSSRRFLELQKEISDAFYQKLEVKNLSYEMILTNDTKRTVTGTMGSVYLDGIPHAFGSPYTIAPGKVARIKISDVLKDSLYQRGSGYFASVRME